MSAQGLCPFVFGRLLYLIQEDQPGRDHIHLGLFLTEHFWIHVRKYLQFEDVMMARWLRPVDAMTNLPFIGQLNTVFRGFAIAFGMGLNILVMTLT